MLTKTKLALALCGSLVAGGLATAQSYSGGVAAGATGANGGLRAKILQKYDTNGDGVLEPDERAAMRADFQAKREAKREKMLATWDSNHDGKLEPDERAAMRQAHAEKAFKKLDTNGDGVLSLDEFEHARMFGPHARRRGFMRAMNGGYGNGGTGGSTGSQP